MPTAVKRTLASAATSSGSSGGGGSSSSRAAAFRARAASSGGKKKQQVLQLQPKTIEKTNAHAAGSQGLKTKKKPGPKPGSKKKRGRPPQSKKVPSAKKPRKSAAQARKERKKAVEEQKKREKEEKKKAGGHIICAADEEPTDSDEDKEGGGDDAFFWEVEAIVGRRTMRGKVEYQVRWKGCPESDNTWEPASNLCDTALADARKFWKEEKKREEKREEDERRLGLKVDDLDSAEDEAGTRPMELDVSPPKPTAPEPLDLSDSSDEESFIDETDEDLMKERKRWKWNDAEQVPFQPVRRIDVNGSNAGEMVTEARKNGIPVVLTGHRGWANFAKRWLKKRTDDASTAKGMGDDEKEDEEASEEAREDGVTSEKKDSADDGTTGKQIEANDEAEEKPANAQFLPAKEKHVDEDVDMNDVASAEGGSAPKESSAKKSPECPGDTKDEGETKDDNSDSSGTFGDGAENLLDLSDPSYYLDVKAMIDDIGTEDVPVVRRNYNEARPIHGEITAAKFLKACWPADSGEGKEPPATLGEGKIKGRAKDKDKEKGKDDSATASAPPPTKSPPLYLHQWQFPLSDTAGRKLCHQSTPLPNSILGEDLLKYWLDLPQCKSDSPLQYIFMGREETLSKLHRDCGGLAISIAPVVGRKECVLVHRSDGANCVYHLQASLDPSSMDLHAHPLLTRARVWRTVVEPGEILLMPQGTYHQCRNVTPCLSYSRFHLDTTNLLPFLQSMLDGDAPELEHDEVLWNCTTELIKKVDGAVDEAQARVKKGVAVPRLDDETVRIVETLRSLRHIIREVARRVAIRNAVKGSARPSGASGGLPSSKSTSVSAMASVGESMMNRVAAEAAKGGKGRKKKDNEKEMHDWDVLVGDVDICLHEFRYRRMEKVPDFKPRRVRAIKNALRGEAGVAGRAGAGTGADGGGRPVVAYNTDLEKGYLTLKKAPPRRDSDQAMTVDSLTVGDKIHVRLEGRRCPGTVLQIEHDLDVAYLSFEDYPSLYDEFQPYDQLRTPPGSFGGEGGAEIAPDDVRAGLAVSHRDWETREEYRAVIQFTTRETMIKVRLELGKAKLARWVRVDWVLASETETKKKSASISEGEREGKGLGQKKLAATAQPDDDKEGGGGGKDDSGAESAASVVATAAAATSDAQPPPRKSYNATVQEWKRRAAIQNRRE